VRYWDTSAIVPLLVEQESSASVKRLLADDAEIVAWWGTAVECVSAMARLRREEILTLADEARVLELLEVLRDSWIEVLPSSELRDAATRLLRVHPLKAADALQLAAARTWAGPVTDAHLVTFDERLARAARLEGFRVLPVA
jgi:uncharacterized protein